MWHSFQAHHEVHMFLVFYIRIVVTWSMQNMWTKITNVCKKGAPITTCDDKGLSVQEGMLLITRKLASNSHKASLTPRWDHFDKWWDEIKISMESKGKLYESSSYSSRMQTLS